MRLIAAGLLLLATLAAHAQAATSTATATPSWTAPTKYVEDGSTIPTGAIDGYAVFYGASRFSSGTTLRTGCAAAPTSQTDTSCYPSVVYAKGTTSTTLSLTITQTTTVYFAVAARTTGGVMSAYSAEAPKQFTVTTSSLTPQPPTTIVVTITLGSCTTNVPGTTCSVTVQ